MSVENRILMVEGQSFLTDLNTFIRVKVLENRLIFENMYCTIQ